MNSETKPPTPGPYHFCGSYIYAEISAPMPSQFNRDSAKSLGYYGGWLIAESIAPENGPLLAAAWDMLMALNRIARLKTHKEMNPRRGNSEEYVSVQAVLDDCITQARAAISTTPSQP